MSDTASPEHSIFSRRFVRWQAVQRLYAFYVSNQAHYHHALDEVRRGLVPDVFDDPPVDQAQHAQEVQQALALFDASCASSSISMASLTSTPPGGRVYQVVTQVFAGYQEECSKALHKLRQGLEASVDKIRQDVLRIGQLLAVWSGLAQQQVEKDKYKRVPLAIQCLAQSKILQSLRNDDAFVQLVREKRTHEDDYLMLISRWYDQFVRTASDLPSDIELPLTLAQEQRLLRFLLQRIVFKQEAIRAFFVDADLHWEAHEPVVKRLVYQEITRFMPSHLRGPFVLSGEDLLTDAAQAHSFYTSLVRDVWRYDKTLTQIIVQKAENWTYDRIVLLDRAILKLALCELLYFDDIPNKVSIDEYVSLAKRYSTPKSGPFVNGLLDAVASTHAQDMKQTK